MLQWILWIHWIQWILLHLGKPPMYVHAVQILWSIWSYVDNHHDNFITIINYYIITMFTLIRNLGSADCSCDTHADVEFSETFVRFTNVILHFCSNFKKLPIIFHCHHILVYYLLSLDIKKMLEDTSPFYGATKPGWIPRLRAFSSACNLFRHVMHQPDIPVAFFLFCIRFIWLDKLAEFNWNQSTMTVG